jgi:hypothetical protein
MQKHFFHFYLIVFFFSTIACGVVDQATRLPGPPEGSIKPDREAAKRVEKNFNQALQEGSPERPFVFRISSQEITSLAVSFLEQRADIPFSKPQIWFENEQIFATAEFEGFGAKPVTTFVSLKPHVGQQGQIALSFDEAKLGNLTMPERIIDSLSHTLNDSIRDLDLGIQVRDMRVGAGELTIIGTRTP